MQRSCARTNWCRLESLSSPPYLTCLPQGECVSVHLSVLHVHGCVCLSAYYKNVCIHTHTHDICRLIHTYKICMQDTTWFYSIAHMLNAYQEATTANSLNVSPDLDKITPNTHRQELQQLLRARSTTSVFSRATRFLSPGPRTRVLQRTEATGSEPSSPSRSRSLSPTRWINSVIRRRE